MVAKTRSHLVAATALAVLAGAGLGAGSARAQSAACLASPNGPAPAGTHWFYKTDQATHQKCWYTRPQDQAAAAGPAHAAASQAAPEQGDAANADSDAAGAPNESAPPVGRVPATVPPILERAALPAFAPRRTAAPIPRIPMPTADPRGDQPPINTASTAVPASAAMAAPPDTVAWPDPPSVAQTAGIAGAGSPFPPPPNVGSQGDLSSPRGAAQAPTADDPPPTASPANAEPAPAATAATVNKPGAGSPSINAGADAPTPTKPPERMSVLLILAGLILLVAAGMLLRRVVEQALGRRRVIKLARQEPRLMEPVAVAPPTPTLRQAPSVVPGQAQTAQRASEVENALRQLAHNLRQRQPAANGTSNSVTGRSGAVVRS